jgi:hypothetical protein
MSIPAAGRTVEPIDNRPPLITIDELSMDHANYVQKAAAFRAKLADLPSVIDDDITCGIWQDIIKDVDTELKSVERTRVDVKAPFLAGERVIDGYFGTVATDLAGTRGSMAAVVGAHLRRKAAAEAARLAEVARKKREEEERQRAEAAEAARRAQALENQRRMAAASEKRVQASVAQQGAMTAGAEAAAANKAASAKPAEHARTRSAGGSLGTLAEHWTFEILDQAKLPAADLWAYVPMAAKETAVRAFVKSGGRKLEGARIFSDTKLQVR